MFIFSNFYIVVDIISSLHIIYLGDKGGTFMNFSNNLRFLRKSHGYSQEFIAEKLGYKSFTTVQKWESGVSEPSVEKLKQLADLFDVTMDEFLYTDFEANKLPREVGKLLDDKEEALLSICRRLRDQNKEKVYEYAALLLRDEHNS